MSKKKSRLNRKIENGLLNTFAIVIAILPIFTVGSFVHAQFFNDPRHAMALSLIEEPKTPRLFEEPLVSVTFDDGWESVYSNAAPLLEKYQIRTTQYILPGEFKEHNYLSVAQAQSLKNAGHEIMSHTMTHPVLTSVDANEVKYQLEESRKQLIDHKLTENKVHFAAPESATNDSIDKDIAGLYASHRNTFSDIENGIDENDVNLPNYPFDRYNIIAYSIRQETTPDQIRDALKYAKDTNGWLVLVYHQIDDSQAGYAINTAGFEKHLQLIKQSHIKTSPLGDVLDHSKVKES